MITYERFMMSFIGADIPETAIVRTIKIDHSKEKILLEGNTVDDNGNIIDESWVVPFYKGQLEYEGENDSDADIIDSSYEFLDE